MKKKYAQIMGQCCFWLFGLMLCGCAEEDQEEHLYSSAAVTELTVESCESVWQLKDCFEQDWCQSSIDACVDFAESFAADSTEDEARFFCREACANMGIECQFTEGAPKSYCAVLSSDCQSQCQVGIIYEP